MACPGVGQVSAAQINDAAQQLGIPCWVVLAQITLESGGRANAVSSANAQGVAQFLPSTFSGLGCPGSPFNVTDAMNCYVRYMKQLLAQFKGSVRDALAAYNAGPGNIQAGMGYANEILTNAHQGSNLTSSGATTSSGGSGSSSSTSTGQLTSAQLTSAFGTGAGSPLGDIIDPFQAFQDAAKAVADALTGGGGTGILGAVQALATAFGGIAGAFQNVLHGVQWLFVPSHWVRIFAFWFGVGALLPGLYALMKTGSGSYGDITLALGILLVTLAGILLFVAFHNLPDDVRNFQQLISWISASVREDKPAASAAG